MTTTVKKATSVAVVKFMEDGSLEVSLSSCIGVNARKIDAVPTALYKKLGELRSIERRKDSTNQRIKAEQAKLDEEKANG